MVSLFKEANPFSKRIPSIDISSLLPFRMTLGALKRWLKCQTRKFRDGLYRKCQVRIFSRTQSLFVLSAVAQFLLQQNR